MTHVTSVFQAVRSISLAEQDGQSVAEYAVAMAVVILVTLVSLSAIGGETLEILRRVAGFVRSI